MGCRSLWIQLPHPEILVQRHLAVDSRPQSGSGLDTIALHPSLRLLVNIDRWGLQNSISQWFLTQTSATYPLFTLDPVAGKHMTDIRLCDLRLGPVLSRHGVPRLLDTFWVETIQVAQLARHLFGVVDKVVGLDDHGLGSKLVVEVVEENPRSFQRDLKLEVFIFGLHLRQLRLSTPQ